MNAVTSAFVTLNGKPRKTSDETCSPENFRLLFIFELARRSRARGGDAPTEPTFHWLFHDIEWWLAAERDPSKFSMCAHVEGLNPPASDVSKNDKSTSAPATPEAMLAKYSVLWLLTSPLLSLALVSISQISAASNSVLLDGAFGPGNPVVKNRGRWQSWRTFAAGQLLVLLGPSARRCPTNLSRSLPLSSVPSDHSKNVLRTLQPIGTE